LTWSGEGGAPVARALSALNLSDANLNALTSLIREVGDKYIYDDAEAERLNQEIVLVDVRNPSGQMVMPAPRTRMLSLAAARQELELRIFGLQGWTQEQKACFGIRNRPIVATKRRARSDSNHYLSRNRS